MQKKEKKYIEQSANNFFGAMEAHFGGKSDPFQKEEPHEMI